MHFPDRRTDQTEERILPLINVVFLLLIFLMIAGSLSVTEPFEIEPPASGSESEPPPEALRILLDRHGRLALDNRELDEAQLLDQLSAQLQRDPQTAITLKADARLPANRMVRLTQALSGVGVKKLRLLTEADPR